jgi:cysteinyl-tRNA synthetase
LVAIGKTKFDLVIMDYSRDGSDERRFTAAEISALKTSPGGPKTVLSYMSIGEAEDYRWYWQRSWDANRDGRPDAGAPAWPGRSNPDWPGNYKVRYWDPAWQQIVYDYVDKVLAAGYDGVYLDIVDAYEYWEPGGPGSPDRSTAEEDMVTFVKDIANYARVTQNHPGFQVFVQNAEELSQHSHYVQAVSGIGKEDLFYNGNRRQPAAETSYSIRQLDRFKDVGKPVLVTDYVTRSAKIDAFYEKASARGYVPYATRRALDALTINRGYAPD